MSPEDKSEPSLAEAFFQQGAERYWRLEAAKSVAGWLKQKTMDYEPVTGGMTRSFLAESVLVGLKTGAIFFRVTEEAPVPARARVLLVRTPLPKGGNYVWKAVTLEVKQGITKEELNKVGDPVLKGVFADHLRVKRIEGRLLPGDKVTVKLAGFGRFPHLDADGGMFTKAPGSDYDLGV